MVDEDHLNHLVSEFTDCYNEERTHQSNDGLPLSGEWSAPAENGKIACREQLGGMLKHYYREAA